MHITAIEQGMLGRRRDRRRLVRPRRRRGARPAPAGQGLRRRLLLRRRRGEPGDPARGLQPGRRARRPGDLRLREQRVGDLDTCLGLHQGRRHRHTRCRLRLPGRDRGRQRRQAVRAVTEEALVRARAGDGPTLIEAKSYRVTAALGSDQDRPALVRGARLPGGRAIPSCSSRASSSGRVSTSRASRRSRPRPARTSMPPSSSRSPRRDQIPRRSAKTSTPRATGTRQGRLS